MKTLSVAVTLVAALPAFGAYQYYYSDTFTSINTTNWTKNGSISTAYPNGLWSGAGDRGSVISKVAVPDGTSDYEIKMTLRLVQSGGRFIQYLHASSNAQLGVSGTYYYIELKNPTFVGAGCTATLIAGHGSGASVGQGASVRVPCRDNMEVRTFIKDNFLTVWVDGVSYITKDWGSIYPTGKPGVGTGTTHRTRPST
jgi:hypothetical protein